ncbi:hypothetical protein Zm00014a_039618 [Zea mays]|uniref:Uncharacterized protein n=1 Tax=Zea mays TaxID=4577 RepID=A0A3L6FLC6_MAIZE|nr:hypothetical protein Zm00014a_039618 [Zea mays]
MALAGAAALPLLLLPFLAVTTCLDVPSHVLCEATGSTDEIETIANFYEGAIGLVAKANGLESVLLATSWILSQMIVTVFVWSQKALHAFHSTHISIVANQPARQEACNQQSCSDPEMTQSVNPKKSGMSGWLVVLVVILGLSAAAGIAFTSYTYYVRPQKKIVYIFPKNMLISLTHYRKKYWVFGNLVRAYALALENLWDEWFCLCHDGSLFLRIERNDFL